VTRRPRTGRRLTLLLLAPLAALTVARGAAPEPAAAPPCVLRAELDGMINAGTADYLTGAVDQVQARGCQALLVVVDTPGGELEATRAIVRAFLAAPVPIIAYVAPSGAHAGSAGMFVTMAPQIAAMAPATSIGAAHPVGLGGADVGDQLERKVVSDVAALARGVAAMRGRNAGWAERAVRESVSATSSEALALDVVDLVAPGEQALLAALDGRVVPLPGGAARLRTAGAERVDLDMSMRQRIVALIGDPTVVYLLFMLGMLGLLIELSSPGLFVPGIAGAVALLLAVIGLGLLPVNVGGVLLMVLGAGFLVAEIFVASYGLLLLAGLAALVAGSALLIDPSDAGFFTDPDIGVSWGAVLPLALAVTGAAAALAWYARRTGRRLPTTGPEALLGQIGETTTLVDRDRGRVRVSGESWSARSAAPIPPGRPVQVRAVRDLCLEVEALPAEGATP